MNARPQRPSDHPLYKGLRRPEKPEHVGIDYALLCIHMTLAALLTAFWGVCIMLASWMFGFTVTASALVIMSAVIFVLVMSGFGLSAVAK